MKVLGISGSPRPRGNTELLLEAALAPFKENGWTVGLHLLSAINVAPCRGCDACASAGACAIPDDMASLHRDMADCDALIIATPVYYRNVTAQLKAVFDRSYAVRAQKPLAGKPGGAIAVGRGTGGGQALTLTIIYNYLLSMGALCVPGELNGVSAVAGEPGEIGAQPDRLRQARVLGDNILNLAVRI